MYINIALHYIRPKQTVHIRDTLQPLIRDVIATDDLDLEVDPKQVTTPYLFPRLLELTGPSLDISCSDRRRGNALRESVLQVKGHLLRRCSQ
jgi:hypothetical protein